MTAAGGAGQVNVRGLRRRDAQAADGRGIRSADKKIEVRRSQPEVEQRRLQITCPHRVAVGSDFGDRAAVMQPAGACRQAQGDVFHAVPAPGNGADCAPHENADRAARGRAPGGAVGIEWLVRRTDELGERADDAEAPAGRGNGELARDQCGDGFGTSGIGIHGTRWQDSWRKPCSVIPRKLTRKMQGGLRYNRRQSGAMVPPA
jgi:hypothetical protein